MIVTQQEQQLLDQFWGIKQELASRGIELDIESMVETEEIPAFEESIYSIYRDRPAEFIREILQADPWSKQVEILEKLNKKSRVSVRSCHGVGKTFIAAASALWFLYTRPNSIVITTAPTARQVTDLIWRTIRGHHSSNQLPGRCLTTKLELGDEWYAQGFSTDDPDKFQGFHSPDLLLLVDEAAGVAQEIFTAAEGILTAQGAKVLLIGNPTSTSGKFFDTHHTLRGLWNPVHISAFDSPNLTGEQVSAKARAALITPEWVEERRQEWGEDSPLYQVRVLGNFPDQSEKSLMALSWLEAAGPRFKEVDLRHLKLTHFRMLQNHPDMHTIVGGMDVARQGNCENVVYARRGPITLGMDAWRSNDLMYTVGRARTFMRKHQIRIMRIDANGMGHGVYDRMVELGERVEAVMTGVPSKKPQLFTLARDEYYWDLRERFREGRIGCVTDQKTIQQLATLEMDYDSHSRVKISTKEEFEKRGIPSPDRADALCLAYLPVGGMNRLPVAGGHEQRLRVVQYVAR